MHAMQMLDWPKKPNTDSIVRWLESCMTSCANDVQIFGPILKEQKENKIKRLSTRKGKTGDSEHWATLPHASLSVKVIKSERL